jgi:hypothetical protein
MSSLTYFLAGVGQVGMVERMWRQRFFSDIKITWGLIKNSLVDIKKTKMLIKKKQTHIKKKQTHIKKTKMSSI